MQSLPFGGVKDSGFDRFAGPEGLRACCLLKSCVSDKFPGLRTAIPAALGYPITPRATKFAGGLGNMLYGDGIIERVKGIVDLATA